MKILNPTTESRLQAFSPAQRVPSLEDKVVGIISNGKQGTERFFEIFSLRLREKFGVRDVILEIKHNYSAPAESEIVANIKNWDLAVTGIGD